jgi:hypothetical protein
MIIILLVVGMVELQEYRLIKSNRERRTANAVDYVKTYGGGLFGSSNMTRVEYQELQPGGNMVGSNITLLGNTHTPEEKAIIGDTEVRNKGGKIIAIPTVTEKTDSVTGDKTYDVTDGNIYIDADNVINEVAEGERVVTWDPGNLGKIMGLPSYDLASVYEPGVISGNNITIIGDTFRNIGSDVLGESSVLIAADSLIEQNWVASHHTINDSARISGFFNISRNTETEHVTRSSTIASNSGDVTLMTQGTFRNTASDIFAGNNIQINANNVEISDGVHQSLNNYSSVSLNFSAPSTVSLDYQSTDYTVTTHRSSNIYAGGNLTIGGAIDLSRPSSVPGEMNIIPGNSITITGSNLAAGETLKLSGQNITIQNGLYTDTVNTTGGGLYTSLNAGSITGGVYGFESNSSLERLTPSTLFAKDVLINANDTTNIQASILDAQDSLTINTNDLLISGKYQKSKSDTVNGGLSVTFVPPTNFSVGVNGGYSYSREGIYQEAVLNAPNLTLNTGNQLINGANINGKEINPQSDYSEANSYSFSFAAGTAGISGGFGYNDFSLFGGIGSNNFIGLGYKQFSLGAGLGEGENGSQSAGVFGSAYGVGFGLSKRIDNPGITNDHPVYTPFVSYGILGLSADFQHGEIKTISSSVGFWTGTTPEINPYDTVCFEKDAPIETKKEIKFIQEIKVGDIVKTWNENIKKFEYKKVLKVFQRIAKQTLHIKLSNNQTMKVTPEHLIYANGVWIKAGEIKQGDKLLGLSNEEIFIESIELIDRETRVYNFETEGNHTYIAFGVVVHNKCDFNVLFDKYSVEDNGKVYDKTGKELSSNEVLQLAHTPLLKDSDREALIGSLNGSELLNLLIESHNESLDLSGDKLGANADRRRELLGYLSLDNKYNDLSGQEILIVNQIEKQNNSDLLMLIRFRRQTF